MLMNWEAMASAAMAGETTSSTAGDNTTLDLLCRLQQAIFSGQHQMAATVASELAKMRVNCSMSMRRSEIQLVDEMSAKEPIRVQVQATTTISDLETQIYLKHKVPIRGRCMLLLETTLPPVENQNGAGTESIGANLGNIVKKTELKNETADAEWACPDCTLLNKLSDHWCSVCERKRDTSNSETDSVVEIIPAAASNQDEFPIEEVYSNYQELLDMEQTDLITNLEAFECPICMSVYHPGDGVVLKTCLHSFCRDCLRQLIETSLDAEIKCPYVEEYKCEKVLQDREVRALVSSESYTRYLQIGMNQAESKMENTFHCKTSDCSGWCEFEVGVDVFICPVCFQDNCLACQAIHLGMNCAEYQRKIQIEAEQNPEARKSLEHLQKMLKKGDAMHCPKCQIVILKRSGCDAIMCIMCKTEICWATKGPRWGPQGNGDISGGCGGCTGLRKCHPKCQGCH